MLFARSVGVLMSKVIDHTWVARWRADQTTFITEILHDPETGKPFVLLDAERRFFEHAWRTDDSGRLRYPEQLYAYPKKSGKTLRGASRADDDAPSRRAFAEGYCAANDLEQAQGRVFQAIRRIVECSPLLRREAKITESRISFPAFDATITALASDYASAAGGNPTISCFDELWAYTSERSRRLWDEMITSLARRIVAGLP